MSHSDLNKRNLTAVLFVLFVLCLQVFGVSADDGPVTVTVSYSGVSNVPQILTVDYADEWLFRPDDVYDHGLMKASFALAAAGFRNKFRDLSEKDFDILDFFSQIGFREPRTDDFNVIPDIDTIASAIAHKKAGDLTLIAVSVSGNNYEQEWLSNLTVDDENRAWGFNYAADKIMDRLTQYIADHHLSGEMRLWVAGFSRAAAISNIFAADAVDSGMFQAVFAYTFATPRTTKEENTERYRNIFNIMNPFDPVPMMPFPEWGFKRYGRDLYLPGMETDSGFNKKYIRMEEEFKKTMVFNPQVNRELHTFFDYVAFFVNSAQSYKLNVQERLIDFYIDKSIRELIGSVSQSLSIGSISGSLIRMDENTRYQMGEFWNFLDYLSQVIYTSFRGQKLWADDIYWDPDLSLQENLAHDHYDRTYRAWLFSDNDPDSLLMTDPSYAHYVIMGDIDAEIIDSDGNFVIGIDRDGLIAIDPADAFTPGFSGKMSDVLLYADRQGDSTLFVLPTDQIFSVTVRSHKEQELRFSYIEYSVQKLRASVDYVYYDEYGKDEIYTDTIYPDRERTYSQEELEQMGVIVVEPWSGDLVYSPSAVMRLENTNVFHPSPAIFLSIPGLIISFMLYILVMSVIVGVRSARRRRKAARSG